MEEDQNAILLDLKTQYENETETSFIDSPTGLFNHGFRRVSETMSQVKD
jgi:hypothetical protein